MSVAQPEIRHPTILAERTAPQRVELDLHLPEQLLFFRGHFENFPVLPGIVQLHWAVQYARRHFDLDGLYPRTFMVKFRDLIRPGEALTLSLQLSGPKLGFDYGKPGAPRSSGQVNFTR